MKLCKVFLKPGLPAVRCMVRFPVPPPAYPRPTARRASRPPGGFRGRPAAAPYAPAFGRGGPAGPPPPAPTPRWLHRPPHRNLPSRTFRRGAARRPPGGAAACGRRSGSAAGAAPLCTGHPHAPARRPPTPAGGPSCGNGPDGLRPSRRLRRRPCGGPATRPAPFSP